MKLKSLSIFVLALAFAMFCTVSCNNASGASSDIATENKPRAAVYYIDHKIDGENDGSLKKVDVTFGSVISESVVKNAHVVIKIPSGSKINIKDLHDFRQDILRKGAAKASFEDITKLPQITYSMVIPDEDSNYTDDSREEKYTQYDFVFEAMKDLYEEASGEKYDRPGDENNYYCKDIYCAVIEAVKGYWFDYSYFINSEFIFDFEYVPGVSFVIMKYKYSTSFSVSIKISKGIKLEYKGRFGFYWEDVSNKPLDSKLFQKSLKAEDNAEFEFLWNDVTLCGCAGMRDICDFITVAKLTADKNNIPYFEVELDCGDVNLYKYKECVDLLIFYFLNCSEKLKEGLHFLLPSPNAVFDAKEYLNGKHMYKGDEYQNNAYSMDVNAAFGFADLGVREFRNINFTGDYVGNADKTMKATNCRFEGDLSKLQREIIFEEVGGGFGLFFLTLPSVDGSGVIEFLGLPPNCITGDKVIISKVGEYGIYGSGRYRSEAHTVDISRLTDDEIKKSICIGISKVDGYEYSIEYAMAGDAIVSEDSIMAKGAFRDYIFENYPGGYVWMLLGEKPIHVNWAVAGFENVYTASEYPYKSEFFEEVGNGEKKLDVKRVVYSDNHYNYDTYDESYSNIEIYVPIGSYDIEKFCDFEPDEAMYKSKVSVVFEDIEKTSFSGNIVYPNNNRLDKLLTPLEKEQKFPTLNLTITPEYEIPNFIALHYYYDYQILEIIKLYYDNGVQDKISVTTESKDSLYFDGVIDYDTSGNFNRGYELDINAALMLDIPFYNVQITGTHKSKKTKLTELTNAYIESDMDGIEISKVKGIIEFVGNAPKVIPPGDAKIVIHKIAKGSKIKISEGLHTLDLSNLSDEEIKNGIPDYATIAVKRLVFPKNSSLKNTNESTDVTYYYSSETSNYNWCEYGYGKKAISDFD